MLDSGLEVVPIWRAICRLRPTLIDRRPAGKTSLHNELADLGVTLVDLALARRSFPRVLRVGPWLDLEMSAVSYDEWPRPPRVRNGFSGPSHPMID
ncbi:MAG: hypothetical protein FD152_3365 [Xanthobacteraceae bacterium]|nr:MAG: hypothetical protein FD152_3365 [Xanthobacteraceae bacterium]